MKTVEKVEEEISRTRAKISTLQTRLRDLERQKTEIENFEIVAAIRKMKSSEVGISELLKSLQTNKKPEDSENET